MMTPRRLIIQFMQGMAEALLRRVAGMQAHDLASQRKKGRDDRQDNSLSSPSSGPPQHWLNLVRRYAPELLQSQTVSRPDTDVVRARPRTPPPVQPANAENIQSTSASNASDTSASTSSVSGTNDNSDSKKHHEPQRQQPRSATKRHEYFSRRLSVVRNAARPAPKKPFTTAPESEAVEGVAIRSRRLFLARTRHRDTDAPGPVVTGHEKTDTSSQRRETRASATDNKQDVSAKIAAAGADYRPSASPDHLQLLVSPTKSAPSVRSGPERPALGATDNVLKTTTVNQDSPFNKADDDPVLTGSKRSAGSTETPATDRPSSIRLVHTTSTLAPGAAGKETLPDWPLFADEGQDKGASGDKGRWPGLHGPVAGTEVDPAGTDRDRARSRERVERLQREQRGDLWNA